MCDQILDTRTYIKRKKFLGYLQNNISLKNVEHISAYISLHLITYTYYSSY